MTRRIHLCAAALAALALTAPALAHPLAYTPWRVADSDEPIRNHDCHTSVQCQQEPDPSRATRDNPEPMRHRTLTRLDECTYPEDDTNWSEGDWEDGPC